MTKFNEDTRVKIPSILHLCRLGYEYLSLKGAKWDLDTNIFTDIFKKSIIRINPDFDEDQTERLLQDTSLLLDNEDLGKAFYEKLISNSGVKLIDFEHIFTQKYDFSVVLKYDEIKQKNYSLSAGQYFDVKIEYVDITHDEFEAKMKGFEDNLSNLFAEGKTLETEIQNNLKGLGYES